MTQPQREALIDLVLLSMFIDSHVSLKEGVGLDTAIEALGWESTKPRDIYILTATAKARVGADSDASVAAFIAQRAGVFADAESKQLALRTVGGMLADDGVAESEAAFLKKLEAALG